MATKKRNGSNVGVSITPHAIEVAAYHPKTFAITQSSLVPMTPGVLSENGDHVEDPVALGNLLREALAPIKPTPKSVNLSMPGTLLRMVDMPKMGPRELYLSLSSEAERYKSFDDTEAIVDFHILPALESSSSTTQRVMFGAVRKDTFLALRRACQAAHVRLAAVDIEPLNTLRAMAGTGVLDSLIQQIGESAFWGTVFVETDRVRFSLWQGSSIIDMREVSMDTREFAVVDAQSPMIFDVLDEIRRTAANNFPAIWLTTQLPSAMASGLSQQLGVPVRPCVLGPSLKCDGSIGLATVGAAMHAQVSFPFDFNFLSGLNASASGGKKDAAPIEEDDGGPGPVLAIAGGVLTVVLMLILWGALAAFDGLYLGSQLHELETRKNTLSAQNEQLVSQIQVLKVKSGIRAKVVEIVEKARIRNNVYLNLASDLKNRIPSRIWIYSVKAGDDLLIEGKGMTYQAVLRFSQEFDRLAYAKEVLIQSIREELDEGQTVFKFKMGGRTEMAKELLPGAESAAASAVPPSKS